MYSINQRKYLEFKNAAICVSCDYAEALCALSLERAGRFREGPVIGLPGRHGQLSLPHALRFTAPCAGSDSPYHRALYSAPAEHVLCARFC